MIPPLSLEQAASIRAAGPHVYAAPPAGVYIPFEIGAGWYTLALWTTRLLEAEIATLPEAERAACHALQVKQKMGELRIHTTRGLMTPKALEILVNSAALSKTLCEWCGRPGVERRGPGIVIACSEHGPGREPTEPPAPVRERNIEPHLALGTFPHVDAFLHDLVAVCRKHQLVIALTRDHTFVVQGLVERHVDDLLGATVGETVSLSSRKTP